MKSDTSTVTRLGPVFPLLSKWNYFCRFSVRLVRVRGFSVQIGGGPVQYDSLVSNHAHQLDWLLGMRWRQFWKGRDFVCHAHTYTSEGGLTGAPMAGRSTRTVAEVSQAFGIAARLFCRGFADRPPYGAGRFSSCSSCYSQVKRRTSSALTLYGLSTLAHIHKRSVPPKMQVRAVGQSGYRQ